MEGRKCKECQFENMPVEEKDKFVERGEPIRMLCKESRSLEGLRDGDYVCKPFHREEQQEC